jgi:hypothetical protein
MNRESLEERKAKIEQQFNDYDTEMKRLQGEHRVLVDMITALEEQETVKVKHKPSAKQRLRKG